MHGLLPCLLLRCMACSSKGVRGVNGGASSSCASSAAACRIITQCSHGAAQLCGTARVCTASAAGKAWLVVFHGFVTTRNLPSRREVSPVLRRHRALLQVVVTVARAQGTQTCHNTIEHGSLEDAVLLAVIRFNIIRHVCAMMQETQASTRTS